MTKESGILNIDYQRSYTDKDEPFETVPLKKALLELSDVEAISNFFRDLCTPTEWKSICDRWDVAQLISRGITYRKIREITGVSTATITRVGRALNEGTGYEALIGAIRRNSKD